MKLKISKWAKLSALLLPLLAFSSCSDSKGNLLMNADPYVFSSSPAQFSEITLPQKITFNYYSDGMSTNPERWYAMDGLPNGDLPNGVLEAPTFTIDSTSECKPTLTSGTLDAGNKVNNATSVLNLAGTCNVGDKLVLRLALDRLVAWHLYYQDAPNCKQKSDGCISSNNADGSYQLLSYTIGSGDNFSSACNAINKIGNITVSNPGTNFSVQSVGTLDAGEKVTVKYTRSTSGGGDRILIRWLTSSQTDSVLIADSSVSGTSASSTQSNGDSYLRAYVAGGTWTVRFSCGL